MSGGLTLVFSILGRRFLAQETTIPEKETLRLGNSTLFSPLLTSCGLFPGDRRLMVKTAETYDFWVQRFGDCR